MDSLLIFAALVVIVTVVVQIFSPKRVEIEHVDVHAIGRNTTPVERLPYVRKKYLMTVAELNFFRAFEKIVGNKYYIIPQVSLAKLVSVEYNEIMRKTYHNKIDRKSVDFVLFDHSFSPRLVVELDDRSHDKYDRQIRDKWLDEVMATVGLPIVHIRNQRTYDAAVVLKMLDNTLVS